MSSVFENIRNRKKIMIVMTDCGKMPRQDSRLMGRFTTLQEFLVRVSRCAELEVCFADMRASLMRRWV